MAWTAQQLPRDLWYDEVYTLFVFAARPVAEIVRDYSAPNNHVLFTLLVKPWLAWSTQETIVRLPSFLAAIATLLLVYLTGRHVAGREAAVLSTVLLAANQMFQNFAVEARGYALSMAWIAALLWITLAMDRGKRRGLAIALLTAAALYTIPTNLLLVAPLALSSVKLTASRTYGWSALGKSVIPWLGGLLLAALLYVPLFDGLRAAEAAIEPSEASLGGRLAADFFAAALTDLWPLALIAAIGWIGWLAVRHVPASGGREPAVGVPFRGRAATFVIAFAMVLLPFALTGVFRLPLYARSFSPLLPAIALAQGLGMALLRRWLLRDARWPPWGLVAGLILVYAVAVPRWVSYERRLGNSCASNPRIQDGYFNYYARRYRPRAVAEYLRDSIPEDRPYAVVFAPDDHYPLQYYLFQAHLPQNNVELRGPGVYRGTLFLVGFDRPDYGAIGRHYRLDPAELARFPRVADLGYYSVYRSPDDFEITVHPE